MKGRQRLVGGDRLWDILVTLAAEPGQLAVPGFPRGTATSSRYFAAAPATNSSPHVSRAFSSSCSCASLKWPWRWA